MRDSLYLAGRYLAHHRLQTAVLVGVVAVVVALPAGLRVLLDRSAEALRARAASTPLLLGARGSALELVLDSLYFDSDTPPVMPFSEYERVAAAGLGTAVPLHTRFEARGFPIVGTTPEYFEQRALTLASGRGLARLGDCVLGAAVARELELAPGARLVSSPETVFDLAGSYPLSMVVTGVLAPSRAPDDRAVFCDVKTAWVIAGFAHGHEDLRDPRAAGSVLERGDEGIVANAALREFNEITPDSIDSFHFHSARADLPLTAVALFPPDARSSALLEGRYVSGEEQVRIVHPERVMEDLLGTVLTVRQYVSAAVLLVGLATLATLVLVFLLSMQVRRREIATLARLGCSRRRLVTIVGLEVCGVVATSLLLAGLSTAVLWNFSDHAVRQIVALN